jgi:hypothetical protein
MNRSQSFVLTPMLALGARSRLEPLLNLIGDGSPPS